MKAEEGNVVVLGSTEALKYELAKALKGGMSYKEACLKYGIKAPSTVRSWVKKGRGAKKFKKSNTNQSRESDSLIRFNKEKRELELALSKMSLKVYCLEIVIEEASKHYQEALKKRLFSGVNAGQHSVG